MCLQKHNLYSEIRLCRSKAKNAQEAHEAVRPTKASRTPDQAPLAKGSQLARLYSLIWARALASQMASAEFLQVPCLFPMSSSAAVFPPICFMLVTHPYSMTSMRSFSVVWLEL